MASTFKTILLCETSNLKNKVVPLHCINIVLALNYMKRSLLTFIFLFFGIVYSNAQLSLKTKPILFESDLKEEIVIPFVELECEFANGLRQWEDDENGFLKKMRFAEKIAVTLTPENSGISFSRDKMKYWLVGVRSEHAKSLNLIFSKFKLPQGGRLYVFTPDEQFIRGAYTAINNKESGKLAITPLPGDELIVLYEEPENVMFRGELEINYVCHDYKGILAGTGRRPLGESASCNIGINCPEGKNWQIEKNGIVRLFINGIDLCTGILLNNTANNGSPYLLTANHCIADVDDADLTIAYFNYENPVCSGIDGDPSHSISGTTILSSSDSLEFTLVELSVAPPDSFRPYYCGWDRSANIPDSTVALHHPIGDNKKLAYDSDSPQKATFKSKFIKNHFWKVLRWDAGTTEGGSSGAPLFDENRRLIGNLSGGKATCASPIEDFFSIFGESWDYYSEPGKQLKKWLDPANTNALTIDGLDPFKDSSACSAFINIDGDQNVENKELGSDEGYYLGHNSYNVTEIMEHFTHTSNTELHTVGIGIGHMFNTDMGVYNLVIRAGGEEPGVILHQQVVKFSDMYEGAVNYIPLENTDALEVSDDYFIGIQINYETTDSISIYHTSPSDNTKDNNVQLLVNDQWTTPTELFDETFNVSAVIEVQSCNNTPVTRLDKIKTNNELILSPNPARDIIFGNSKQDMINKVDVFDLVGKKVNVRINYLGNNQFSINCSKLKSGTYFVNVYGNESYDVGKLIIIH
ncbi:T9SS type A sorting domain-containing protein [Puteibacter caeruleilacunae]|nr:T9SS type A sorting domain-containing protein [Puteibacter caeruleilacunae]